MKEHSVTSTVARPRGLGLGWGACARRSGHGMVVVGARCLMESAEPDLQACTLPARAH